VAKSKSAKRRNTQNRRAQQQAQRRSSRSKQHAPQHLPKVGTPRDDAYIQRRRHEDLVDFGLGRRRRGAWIAIVAIALVALIALIILLVL